VGEISACKLEANSTERYPFSAHWREWASIAK
jgi:hypothetical protein